MAQSPKVLSKSMDLSQNTSPNKAFNSTFMDVEALQEIISNLRKRLSETEKQNVELSTAKKRLKREVEICEKQMEDLLNEKAVSMSGRIGDSMKANAMETSKLNSLKQLVRDLQNTLTEKEHEINDLKNELKQSRAAELQMEAKTYFDKCVKMQKLTGVLKQRLQENMQRNEALEADLLSERQRSASFEELQRKHEELVQVVAQLREDNRVLEKANSKTGALKNRVAAMRKRQEQTEETLANERRKVQSLEGELQRERQDRFRLRLVERQVDELVARHEDMEMELRDKIEAEKEKMIAQQLLLSRYSQVGVEEMATMLGKIHAERDTDGMEPDEIEQQESITALIEEIDTNNDGEIDKKELIMWLHNNNDASAKKEFVMSWLMIQLDRAQQAIKEMQREPALRALVARAEAEMDPSNPDKEKLSVQYQRLGSLYFKLGRLDEAREMYEGACALTQSKYGALHKAMIPRLTHIAPIYRKLEMFEEYDAVCNRLLNILEANVDPADSTMLQNINALMSYYMEDIETHRESLIENVVERLDSLAGYLEEEEDMENARLYILRLMNVLEKMGIADEPASARYLVKLAIMYEQEDNHDAAIKIMQRVVTSLADGGDDFKLFHVRTCTHLGHLLTKLERHDEAEEHYAKAWQTFEEMEGPENVLLGEYLINAAANYENRSMLAEAEEFYQRAWDLHLQGHFWEYHPDIATDMFNLARVLGLQGNEEQAAEYNYQAGLIMDVHRAKCTELIERVEKYDEASESNTEEVLKDIAGLVDDLGANISTKNSAGMTPLMLAVSREQIGMVRFLLSKGAPIDDATEEGFTALYYAAVEKRNPYMTAFLVDCGANIRKKDYCGISVFRHAARFNDNIIMAALMGKSRGSFLLAAAFNGDIEVLEFLNDVGMDLGGVGPDGMNCLHLAVISGHEGMVKTILKRAHHLVDSQVATSLETPLMLAAQRGHVNIIALLMEYDADTDLADASNMTAYDHAMANDQQDAAQFISLPVDDKSTHRSQKSSNAPNGGDTARTGGKSTSRTSVKSENSQQNLKTDDFEVMSSPSASMASKRNNPFGQERTYPADPNEQLIVAASSGDAKGCLDAIARGAYVDTPSNGNTPLHLALQMLVPPEVLDNYSAKPPGTTNRVKFAGDAIQLTQEQKDLIRTSWETAYSIKEDVSTKFYELLFEVDPSTQPLFENAEMADQGMKLMDTLNAAIGLLDDVDTLVPVLQQLGSRHVGYGVVDSQYDSVGQALIGTFKHFFADGWTGELEEAWTTFYGGVSKVMIEATQKENAGKPTSLLSAEDISAIRTSWETAYAIKDEVSAKFYETLFQEDPSTEALFADSDMGAQGMKLMDTLNAAIGLLEDMDALVPILQQLGKRHVNYGVTEDHYVSVGSALLATLEHFLGDAWVPSLENAWKALYGTVAAVMKAAAMGDPGILTPRRRDAIKSSWETAYSIKEEVATKFYELLFEMDPSTQPLFENAEMADQGMKLMDTLNVAVGSLEDAATLVPVLEQLAVRHVDYGVEERHYDSVGAALLATFEHFLGEGWTDAVKGAWSDLYDQVATVMKAAAGQGQGSFATLEAPSLEFSADEQSLIRQFWEHTYEDKESFSQKFYDNLFTRSEEVKAVFDRANIDTKGFMQLMGTMNLLVESIEDPASVEPVLDKLARRHLAYGVADDHYETIGASFLEVMGMWNEDKGWNGDVAGLFRRLYNGVSHIMRKSMEKEIRDGTILAAAKREDVRSSWETAYSIKEEVATKFYELLFEMDPSTQPLFENAEMADQGMKLMDTLNVAIGSLEDAATLVPVLEQLAVRHVDYGVEERHYDSVGAALLATFEHFLGEGWTDAVKGAWTELYTKIAATMKKAVRPGTSSSSRTRASAGAPAEILTAGQKDLIRTSWETAYSIKEDVSTKFYELLFEVDPSTQPLFENAEMADQGMKLMDTLNAAIGLLDDVDTLVPVLQQLGSRHVGYGVVDSQYDSVGQALIGTFKHFFADGWTGELEEAWTALYGKVAEVMKGGDKKSDQERGVSRSSMRSSLHSAGDMAAHGTSDDVFKVVKVLVSFGADVTLRNQRSLTPLMIAVMAQHTPSIHLLLKYGADPDEEDASGRKCADLADSRGLKDLLGNPMSWGMSVVDMTIVSGEMDCPPGFRVVNEHSVYADEEEKGFLAVRTQRNCPNPIVDIWYGPEENAPSTYEPLQLGPWKLFVKRSTRVGGLLSAVEKVNFVVGDDIESQKDQITVLMEPLPAARFGFRLAFWRSREERENHRGFNIVTTNAVAKVAAGCEGRMFGLLIGERNLTQLAELSGISWNVVDDEVTSSLTSSDDGKVFRVVQKPEGAVLMMLDTAEPGAEWTVLDCETEEAGALVKVSVGEDPDVIILTTETGAALMRGLQFSECNPVPEAQGASDAVFLDGSLCVCADDGVLSINGEAVAGAPPVHRIDGSKEGVVLIGESLWLVDEVGLLSDPSTWQDLGNCNWSTATICADGSVLATNQNGELWKLVPSELTALANEMVGLQDDTENRRMVRMVGEASSKEGPLPMSARVNMDSDSNPVADQSVCAGLPVSTMEMDGDVLSATTESGVTWTGPFKEGQWSGQYDASAVDGGDGSFSLSVFKPKTK